MESRRSEAPSPLVVGTPQHYDWLLAIVKTVLVLNLLDAIFTLVWVRSGLALEANPLIDQLVTEQPLLFFGVKLGLVGMGSWLLWSQRERPFAVVSIFVAFLAYYCVLLYHLQYAAGLVRNLLSAS